MRPSILVASIILATSVVGAVAVYFVHQSLDAARHSESAVKLQAPIVESNARGKLQHSAPGEGLAAVINRQRTTQVNSGAAPKPPSSPPASLKDGQGVLASAQSDPAKPNLQERIAKKYDRLVTDDGRAFPSEAAAAHGAVQNEAIDPDWSPVANKAIADALNDTLGDRFDTSLIDCRTDICEIRASGKEGGDCNADTRNFQDAWFDLRKKNGFQGVAFDDQLLEVSAVSSPNNCTPVFLIFVTRQ